MEKIFMRSTRALLTGAAVFVTMTATTAHAVENLKDKYADLGCGDYLAGLTDDNELTPKCLNLKERIERIEGRINTIYGRKNQLLDLRFIAEREGNLDRVANLEVRIQKLDDRISRLESKL